MGGDTAELLTAWCKGDILARERLFEILYADLSRIASGLLEREHRHVSLFTGDLVNEALSRLLQSAEIKVNDRRHLVSLCARVMRRVLVDAARGHRRQKRAGVMVTLSQADHEQTPDVDLLALERALMRLAAIDPGLAEIVELRYFAGMSVQDLAEALDVAPATINRKWAAARLWLLDAIKNDF
ncbi:MAG: sigma-70 family RNA polymerase sigma factor [Oricola sp.]|nr:sigma-70 family RNA polymerase sigma factor [Oricola sp.]